MGNETDRDRVRKRFGEIFTDVDIESHPLYQSLIKDLSSRTFASVMADLEEAAEHKKTEAPRGAPGWHDESLSV